MTNLSSPPVVVEISDPTLVRLSAFMEVMDLAQRAERVGWGGSRDPCVIALYSSTFLREMTARFLLTPPLEEISGEFFEGELPLFSKPAQKESAVIEAVRLGCAVVLRRMKALLDMPSACAPDAFGKHLDWEHIAAPYGNLHSIAMNDASKACGSVSELVPFLTTSNTIDLITSQFGRPLIVIRHEVGKVYLTEPKVVAEIVRHVCAWKLRFSRAKISSMLEKGYEAWKNDDAVRLGIEVDETDFAALRAEASAKVEEIGRALREGEISPTEADGRLRELSTQLLEDMNRARAGSKYLAKDSDGEIAAPKD